MTVTKTDTGLDVVTGAFSYSGKAIAEALVDAGRSVRTITGHPGRAPGETPIEAHPLDFDDPISLQESLSGVTTLFNTYWVRFAHGRSDHDIAVANSRALFQAARRAGVQRIVHVSITHPAIDSPYPYFRGKALVERSLAEADVPYAIVRPSILFGGDGVLLNNIAWLLRHLPVFGIGGRGSYRVRPIHVNDLAALCLAKAAESGNSICDAVGPDRPTFAELVSHIKDVTGARSLVVQVPGAIIPVLAHVLSWMVRDVVLTRDEYLSMAEGLADTDGPPTGQTSVMDWLSQNGAELGSTYANELQRHFDTGRANRP